MQSSLINIEADGYRVYIRKNFNEFTSLLDTYQNENKIFVVTDRVIEKLYPEIIQVFIEKYNAKVFSFNGGEENKNINTVNLIYKFLAENGADRSSILIAFGGGIVGDITGFSAATYMRGIKFINIPTTLTSQVDSSIGGKTGYNFGKIKNLVGCFYNPMFVYISTSFLETLSKELFLDGMGEVIKYGVIKNISLLNFVNENYSKILSRNEKELFGIVQECVNIKIRVVEDDFRDNSIRNILNFGHTAGHAIEASSGYSMSHGFAVSLGMLVAVKLSERILGLPKEIYESLIEIYKKLGIPYTYKVDNYSSFLYAIKHDKKNTNSINFVLLEEIERCKIRVPVDEELLIWALKSSIDREC